MKIGYINPDVPEVKLPEIRGERSEALVPDTLDLAERAALVIHGMTGPTDPEADYEVYWRAHFRYHPAIMLHAPADVGIRSKFQIALPLMRLVSGSDLDRHVEQRWLELLLHEQGPDGLIATPLVGRPWGVPSEVEAGAGLNVPEGDFEQMIEPQHNGFCIAAACHYGSLCDRDFWEAYARRIVDGYRRLVVRDGDEAIIPKWLFAPGDLDCAGAEPPRGIMASAAGWSALGMNRCWRVFGYEPARDLGGQLLRYILRSSGYFAPDGSFGLDVPDAGPDHSRYGVTHFHAHTLVLLHALDHAQMTGDAELADLTRRGFQKALSYGESTVGWFPERVTGLCYPQACELCCTADMIMMALLYAAGGDDACWDHADRWLRNQFAECQLRRVDWIHRMHTGEPPSQPHDPRQEGPTACTDDRVAERNIGAFSGWADVNEWMLLHEERKFLRGIQHCCTGNAARALYLAWNHAVEHAGGVLRVNLLLNRAGPWADVDSHIPYAGQVDVHVKQPVDLRVRIPEWVKPAEAAGTVNGKERRLDFDGRYAKFGSCKPGDAAVLAFPIGERPDVIHVERRRYDLVRKGNEVVVISPPGLHSPL